MLEKPWEDGIDVVIQAWAVDDIHTVVSNIKPTKTNNPPYRLCIVMVRGRLLPQGSVIAVIYY